MQYVRGETVCIKTAINYVTSNQYGMDAYIEFG